MSRVAGERLAGLFQQAGTVLLDFDGPLCDLFGVLRASDVAHLVRQFAAGRGGDLSEIQTGDPLELLRSAYRQSAEFGHAVEECVITHELEAAVTAVPTPGGHEVVRRVCDSGRRVVVVSNNSAQPIRSYLKQHALDDAVAGVIGRPLGHPERMKPSPRLLEDGLMISSTSASGAVFVGDSITDVLAAEKANVACVGFAKGDPDRVTALEDAGATAVVLSMCDLEPVFGSSWPSA